MNIRAYVRIARPDHWVKNVFVAPGLLLAFFFMPTLPLTRTLLLTAAGVVCACLIASSNYVLNELLDAAHDRHHPDKRYRPVPSGEVNRAAGYALWLGLAVVGVALSLWISLPFALAGLSLWVMGVLYNVPPIRLKDLPYTDVLSESINNPIRLAMGWYAALAAVADGSPPLPPTSVLGAYWMFGAFLMAAKRFAELRHIGDPARAGDYRKSFRYYTETRLAVSIINYVTLFGMFAGVFISRYRMELLLAAPLVALAMGRYMRMAYASDSLVQHPERLYQDRRLFALVIAAFLACAVLMFVNVPALRTFFLPASALETDSR